MITEEIEKMLDAPLDPGRVAMLTFGGRRAPYLEGWDVIACANAIFGFDGWSHEVLGVESAGPRLYTARVRVNALGIERVDVGTGIASGDTPEAHETAIKGAATDGLKRALRTFGAQFGNDLYDKSGPHEAPRDEPAPPRAAPRPAVTMGSIDTVGALLTWALTQHQMTKDEALFVIGVEKVSDIKDIGAAQAAIESAIEAQKQPAGV